jgi:hypothetical protein
MAVIDTLKDLLGDGVNQTAAQFCLDDCTRLALDYCHLEELPAGLESTVIRMAVDMYRLEGYGQAVGSLGEVTSIKEGDTTITFEHNKYNTQTGAGGAALLKNYSARLNAFRKVRW